LRDLHLPQALRRIAVKLRRGVVDIDDAAALRIDEQHDRCVPFEHPAKTGFAGAQREFHAFVCRHIADDADNELLAARIRVKRLFGRNRPLTTGRVREKFLVFMLARRRENEFVLFPKHVCLGLRERVIIGLA